MSERTPSQAIAEYAARFHAALGPVHAAASPLAAWMLLAFVARAATGDSRKELETALGVPVETAAEFARSLLDRPHPAIATAIAVWNSPDVYDLGFGRWHEALPPAVERGPIPSPEVADAWLRGATRGILSHMPLARDPLTVLILASAIAAEGKWHDPFQLAPSSALGQSPWASQVVSVLSAWDQGNAIRWTPSAGLVAVHVRPTRRDFIVTSVIAAPEVPHDRVIAAAHEVASGGGDPKVEIRSLFDLPLGEGHAWTITEKEIPTAQADTRTQSGHIVLPAWTANASAVDLMKDRAFGFEAAADTLAAIMLDNPEGYVACAVQATNAAYDRYGFRAASVTQSYMNMGVAMRPPKKEHGLHRHVEVRFGRPYAVVAYSDAPAQNPWLAVPLFSAWVTQPMEPASHDE